MCLSGAEKFQSPSLPVVNILSGHFNHYGFSRMGSYNVLCKLTIVIPEIACLFRITKAVSSTIELVNSKTSDSIN
jgi:hypothetical protein